MQRIADADPDVVFSATFADDAKLQFRQLRELGLEAPWYVMYPTVIGLDDFSEADGNLFGIEVGWASRDATDWAAAFEASSGEPASTPWPALAYDSVMLAAHAVADAASDDPADVEAAFAAAAAEYEGPSGTFELDDDNTRVNAVFERLQLTDGGYVPVE
jgi:ABC-type branched-subunit amino acid transport system substrate-binding protein